MVTAVIYCYITTLRETWLWPFSKRRCYVTTVWIYKGLYGENVKKHVRRNLAIFSIKKWLTLIVLLLRAKNNPNCSFCDKSMKLPRMTNLYKVNIFWYGAIPNLQPGPRYAHVKKLRIWPLHGNEAELKCLFLSLLWNTLPRFLAL